MVQRYELTEDFAGNVAVTPVPDCHKGSWVSYEDYENLAKSVRACAAAIREGSLTVEHVQGYLEGVVGVLDDN